MYCMLLAFKALIQCLTLGCVRLSDMQDVSLEDLMEAAYSNTSAIRTWVSEMVSTYHPADAEHGGVKDFKYDKLLKSEDV